MTDGQQRLAVITGGGSGMGRAWARRLASEGTRVVLLDLNEAGMAETARGHEERISFRAVDVAATEEVAKVFADIEHALGPVDRVANAAAIMPFGRLLEQDPKQINQVMSVNYTGLVNVAAAALPPMLARGQGEFISFSSMTGLIPGLLMGAYAASKAAVQFYSEILYHENRNRGVRFACVCPPPVRTPLLNQARDTVWPKFFDQIEHLEPDTVLDAIESALERGEFFVDRVEFCDYVVYLGDCLFFRF